MLALSTKAEGWKAKGSPCPLQSHQGTTGTCRRNPKGCRECLLTQLEGGRFGSHIPGAIEHPTLAVRVLTPIHPSTHSQQELWAPHPMSHNGFCPWRAGKSLGLRPLHLQPGPRWEAACTH